MEYAQIKGDDLILLPTLPAKIRLADGSERTGLDRMTEAERNAIGVYGYELNPPGYDPETQWRKGPIVEFDGAKVTASYEVIDKTPEELALEVDCLREPKKQEIADAWGNDIKTVGMPVEGQDFSVDYGVEDVLIWRGAVKRVPEDATEVAVRAIDNSFHVISRELFVQIPDLQEDYYAKMLQKKWALQKAVDSATKKSEIESILWDAGEI